MFRFIVCFSALFLLWFGSSPVRAEEPTQDQRLAELIRIWGEVRFFHPEVSGDQIDWDKALVEAAPMVMAARDAASYEEALNHLFSFLNDPQTKIQEEEPPPDSPSALNLKPVLKKLESGVVHITIPEIDSTGLQIMNGDRMLLSNLFQEVKGAAGLIVDLRQVQPQQDYRGLYFFDQSMKAVLGGLTDQPLLLPSKKTRFHSGYNAGFGSGGYYSGVMLTEHETIPGTGVYKPDGPMVFIFNEMDTLFLEKLASLQTAGRAWLICESEEVPVLGDVRILDLYYNLKCKIRTSETVNADSTFGFRPALHLKPGEGDEAMKAALAMVGGELKPEIDAQKGSLAPLAVSEGAYSKMTAPDETHRLLALARYWNIIRYFYPYRHLLDRPWDETLQTLIPIFRAAEGELAYALAVARAAASMQDTHGFVRAKALQDYFGQWAPAVKVSYVEGRVAVVYCDPDVKGLAVGDVVLTIDGQTIAQREAALKPYLSHSTPQALLQRMAGYMLTGSQNSEVVLEVEDGSGAQQTLTLTRSQRGFDVARAYREKRSPGAFKLLDQGFGYMDLNYLTRAQVEEAFKLFENAPGLIIDIRGYPKGTAWAITPHLSETKEPAASFSRPLVMTPDPDFQPDYAFIQRIPAGGKKLYKGKIVVLINEDAISQSEHTCLFLESSGADVTFLGTPTNGANGDITAIQLPGGIKVNFTGHDVRHADGSQLQRLGIQPDVLVAPGLKALRAGEDDVLQAGIRFLETHLNKTNTEGQ